MRCHEVSRNRLPQRFAFFPARYFGENLRNVWKVPYPFVGSPGASMMFSRSSILASRRENRLAVVWGVPFKFRIHRISILTLFKNVNLGLSDEWSQKRKDTLYPRGLAHFAFQRWLAGIPKLYVLSLLSILATMTLLLVLTFHSFILRNLGVAKVWLVDLAMRRRPLQTQCLMGTRWGLRGHHGKIGGGETSFAVQSWWFFGGSYLKGTIFNLSFVLLIFISKQFKSCYRLYLLYVVFFFEEYPTSKMPGIGDFISLALRLRAVWAPMYNSAEHS